MRFVLNNSRSLYYLSELVNGVHSPALSVRTVFHLAPCQPVLAVHMGGGDEEAFTCRVLAVSLAWVGRRKAGMDRG